MPEPYSVDFPELIKEPADSYAQTLEQAGVDETEITVQLLAMDIMVKHIARDVRDALPFRAPETFFVDDVREIYGLGRNEDIGPETVACLNKALKVLRGEMEPNPIWTDDEAVA